MYDLVRLYQRDSILLKEPNLARWIAARTPAKTTKVGKTIFGAVAKGPSPGGDGKTAVAGKGKDKGKDKGKSKTPATPTKSVKKRAAPDPGDEGSKKKKKSKEVPEPPARVDATPRSGPIYDSELYQTPLDWPMIYRMKDELWCMDVFERLREVRRRVESDYQVMRSAAISQGWWSEGDDTSVEGSDSGSSDSADVLNVAK